MVLKLYKLYAKKAKTAHPEKKILFLKVFLSAVFLGNGICFWEEILKFNQEKWKYFGYNSVSIELLL